jgi:hypothetical protein
LLCCGDARGCFFGAHRFDRISADARFRRQSGMRCPLDVAVPFAHYDEYRKLLQVFRQRALEAQLRPHRRQITGCFGVMQQRPKLGAYFGSVAVATNAVVNFLPFGVQFLSFYVTNSSHFFLPDDLNGRFPINRI